MNDLFLDILDEERKSILPYFADFKDTYYLAGGTGLALQIGHRDSIDFDFFRPESFSAEALRQQLEGILRDKKIAVIQEEKDTLTVLINEKIKISFFSYPYPLIKPLVSSQFFNLASIEDVGCMKLSAITSRSVLKDYVDLFFILKHISLTDLLRLTEEKFPNFNSTVSLKSLTYFDDITQEPILYKHGHEVSFETIKEFLQNQVRQAMKKTLS